MQKPTIKELVQQYKPTNAEESASTVIEHWPIYGNMRSLLVDMVQKEINAAAKERLRR